MDTTDSAYGDKLIRLDTFDTAVAVDPSAEDDAKRRFMTLILQTAHRNNGNIGHVLRATNTSGEVFAVKLLKDNAILSDQAPDRSAEQSAAHLANTAALFVVLFLEQCKKLENRPAGVMGILCAAASLAVFGADNMVIPAMVLVLAVLLSARHRLDRSGEEGAL